MFIVFLLPFTYCCLLLQKPLLAHVSTYANNSSHYSTYRPLLLPHIQKQNLAVRPYASTIDLRRICMIYMLSVCAGSAVNHTRCPFRYSSLLQMTWESDQGEWESSEESWNLQGWLSVGSHKLVQQTLRALVRRCSHPYAVRKGYILCIDIIYAFE